MRSSSRDVFRMPACSTVRCCSRCRFPTWIRIFRLKDAKWEYAWDGGAWPTLSGGHDNKWQYALDTDAAKPDGGIRIQRKAMPAHWNWSLDAPLTLLAPARAFDWKPTDAQALPDKPVKGTASETIRLIPYGCTKFRISMFPVTPKVAGASTSQ